MRSIFTRAGVFDLLRARYDEGRASRGCCDASSASTAPSGQRTCVACCCSGLRNTSTGSPWPVSSNPAGRYNQGPGSNLDLPLWQLVRASAAAPTFFVPEEIELGARTFVFSDGAVTTLNNPALQLVLMATLPAYTWPGRPVATSCCWSASGPGPASRRARTSARAISTCSAMPGRCPRH